MTRPAVALWLLPLALACSSRATSTGEDGTSDARIAALEALNAQTIATYRAWQAASVDQQAAVAAYCAAPGADTLQAARAAWWAARAPWKHSEIVMFGPATEQPYRIYPLADLWPARTDTIEALLASSAAVSADAVAAMGGATRGMPALEYMLWTEDPLPAEARRCAYAAGLAADLVALSDAMAKLQR